MGSLHSVGLGLLAEVTSAQFRGRILGGFACAKHLGLAVGCFMSPWLSSQNFGIEGWRISVLAIGVASIVVGFIVAVLMKEPPREVPLTDMEPGVRAELWRMLSYCSFDRQFGLADCNVSVSSSFRHTVCVMCRNSEASVLLTLPICFFVWKVQPPSGWELLCEASLISGMGFTSAWVAGVCLPMLVELAPIGRKSGIMAWEMALQGIISLGGAWIVGVCAPKMVGHELPGAHTAMSMALQQVIVDLHTSSEDRQLGSQQLGWGAGLEADVSDRGSLELGLCGRLAAAGGGGAKPASSGLTEGASLRALDAVEVLLRKWYIHADHATKLAKMQRSVETLATFYPGVCTALAKILLKSGDAKLGSKLVVASCSCLTSWITVVLGAEPGQWPQDSCEPRAALAALFALQNGRSVEDDVGRG
eukprot:g4242.t1